MRKQILTLLVAGLIGLMRPTASHAGPLDFMFSFSNTIGNVSGTVTGEVFGLTDNATGPASNVVVDSYPAALGLPAPPLAFFTNILINSFTVTNEMIIAARYLADNTADTAGLILNSPPENGLATNSGTTVINIDGFAGVTYTPLQPVPEPSSVTVLGTGFGLLAALLWVLSQRLGYDPSRLTKIDRDRIVDLFS
jgi:hypothetical protein